MKTSARRAFKISAAPSARGSIEATRTRPAPLLWPPQHIVGARSASIGVLDILESSVEVVDPGRPQPPRVTRTGYEPLYKRDTYTLVESNGKRNASSSLDLLNERKSE